MNKANAARGIAILGLVLSLAACDDQTPDNVDPFTGDVLDEESVLDLFGSYEDPNITLEVNRYLWRASLDVLSFMPLKAADPFSGVMVFDYGVPPGGRTAYRATVHIADPALDARSLNLALATRSGAAAPDTVRAVENAILTRARQLRIAEEDL